MRHLLALLPILLLATSSQAKLQTDTRSWIEQIASMPIQHKERIMPMDTFAKEVAVKLTGRSTWSNKRAPEAFHGKHRVELLLDLIFQPQSLVDQELITIENRPFKREIGLDETRKFFTINELAQNREFDRIVNSWFNREDPEARPTKNQKIALDVSDKLNLIAGFMQRRKFAIVPNPDPEKISYLSVSASAADPGAESVLTAFQNFGNAYTSGQGISGAFASLQSAINAVGTPDERIARTVKYEVFYNNHNPWLWTAVLYGFAIVAIGLSSVCLRRTLFAIGIGFVVWGTIEQVLGLSLRVMILGRPPVSNTYEALLWMGLVSIAVGSVAQVINRKSWYIFAATIAAELSVLFAMLVPLADQTNVLQPVLRSNYWLIIHVMTIVASYAVLMLAAVLAHVYLVKHTFFRKSSDQPIGRSHPLVIQTYRAIQIGVLLLTIGTILGGVWAADSWGRFWGWDPKETWALISIVLYFTMLHARHIGWLRDFGLAVAAIVGFMAIVWTFYGVNYVMGTGLHSYGFGSGGEFWVGLWALIETVFLVVCKVRQVSMNRSSPAADNRALKTADDASPESPPASSPA